MKACENGLLNARGVVTCVKMVGPSSWSEPFSYAYMEPSSINWISETI